MSMSLGVGLIRDVLKVFQSILYLNLMFLCFACLFFFICLFLYSLYSLQSFRSMCICSLFPVCMCVFVCVCVCGEALCVIGGWEGNQFLSIEREKLACLR